MQCPKCDGEMGKVNDDPVSVHRCNDCHGLYFDQLTRELLDAMGGHTAIDTGDEELGAEYDEMVFVDCPNCFRMMDQRQVGQPVRIRFEFCPTCYATFLDAGEFRQYVSADYLGEFRLLLPAEPA